MKIIRNSARRFFILSGVVALLNCAQAQTTRISSPSSANDLSAMMQAVVGTTPLPAESVSRANGYYSAQNPFWPPLPGNPNGLSVWPLGNGTCLLDDWEFDYSATSGARAQTMSTMAMSVPNPGDGGISGNGNYELLSDPRRNYTKFANQVLSTIDTNSAAANNTNLYHICTSIPNDAGTTPKLQIARYGTNAIVIKASHFNYSGESRDFALLVCDKLETPIWKKIDFAGASDSQDGWLVQATIPNWQVADPMFFMVTNIAHDCNAFFHVIPYGGPQVSFSGVPQPNDTVSNTITLKAQILDLTGVTNDQFQISVDGLPARYTYGASNTVNLETKYNPNDWHTIYLDVANKASVYDATNAPGDTKIFFSGTASIPLNFTNHTCLVFVSYITSPDIGTTYFEYFVDKAQNVAAIISDPSDGHMVLGLTNYISNPGNVVYSWNFTDADGVTPYTNDTYVVHFIAFDPDDVTTTNTIDRHGVRTAAGNIITYEQEDPSVSAGPYLNSQAAQWIDNSIAPLYETLYDWDWPYTLTDYYPSDIGNNRDNQIYLFPWILTGGNEQGWANQTIPALANLAYSDFNFYMGHGNGTAIGGGPPGSTFVMKYLDTQTALDYVARPSQPTPNWRMRKVALWACYTDTIPDVYPKTYTTWPEAFGIRPTSQQLSNWMMKNVGLFFQEGLPQGGYSGTYYGTQVEVAANFDLLWVAGPYPFPGGCDPTYAFAWVFNVINGMSPELAKGWPHWVGFGYLPYSGVYDSELMVNNVSHVKR